MTSRAGNQYVMIAYHSSDLILAQPFATSKDKHRIEAYSTIITRLKAAGLDVDLQLLDNDASKDYKEAMIKKWKAKYQLVPPDVHRRNAAERAIRTFTSDSCLPDLQYRKNEISNSSTLPNSIEWEISYSTHVAVIVTSTVAVFYVSAVVSFHAQ